MPGIIKMQQETFKRRERLRRSKLQRPTRFLDIKTDRNWEGGIRLTEKSGELFSLGRVFLVGGAAGRVREGDGVPRQGYGRGWCIG